MSLKRDLASLDRWHSATGERLGGHLPSRPAKRAQGRWTRELFDKHTPALGYFHVYNVGPWQAWVRDRPNARWYSWEVLRRRASGQLERIAGGSEISADEAKRMAIQRIEGGD